MSASSSHAPVHAAPASVVPVLPTVTFKDLGLGEMLLRALSAERYTHPTPIQAKGIPPVLDGRDVVGCAQTGTGKTAAFALPILHRLFGGGSHPKPQAMPRKVRCLVLSPTRELASQINESFRTYGRHTGVKHAVIYGGVGQGPQVQALRGGLDVLIATPGRLQDLIEQGYVDLRSVEVFVLDEADNMLDMGFIHAIRRIIPKLPPVRQNLLFSATMPPEIRTLANTILRNPVSVQVAPVGTAAETVKQSVYFVDKRNKPTLLQHYIENNGIVRTLVFTRTKHGADKVAKHLLRCGIKAEAIHGNKSQNHRSRTLANFKSSKPPVLVATDVAARGLDIDEVSHVINFDVPNVAETYVHRIGRTGRAGASGIAVSFCDGEERPYLRQIEKLIRKQIVVETNHPHYPAGANETVAERPMRVDPRLAQAAASRGAGNGNSGGRSQGRRHGPSGAPGYQPSSERRPSPAVHASGNGGAPRTHAPHQKPAGTKPAPRSHPLFGRSPTRGGGGGVRHSSGRR